MPELEAAPSEALESGVVETPSTPEPSMEDSIREKFRELTATGTTKDAETGEDVAAEPAAPTKTKTPAKGPDGKFLKSAAPAKPVSTPADEVADPAEPAVAESETPEQTAAREAEEAKAAAEPAKPASKFVKAPSSYKAEVAADWDKTPESVRAEIFRREEDMHKGLGQYKQLADIGKLFDTEFRPYEAMIRGAGMTAPQLVRNWLNTEYQLQTASPQKKAELFAQYAKHYQIDIDAAVTAYQSGPAAEPPADPRVADLEKQVTDMKTQREKEVQEAREREQSEIRKEVETFATSHPHYDSVKLDMAALMKDGRATTLQEAYDKAIWADPTVRKALEAQQHEELRKQNADKAAKAKQAASTNVAKRGTPPAKPVMGTMDDTLRAKFRELTGTHG